jgi:prenyl protein peptidase
MLVAQASIKQTIFLSPVIFGLSHFHHFYEFRLMYPHVPVAGAVLRSVFQLSYTTLFGAYATFIFVRSGSLLSVCLIHTLCNCMGLPQVWGPVRPAAHDDDNSNGGPQRGGGGSSVLMWTVMYYTLLVAGAVSWWASLWSLTESKNALIPSSSFGRV